MKFQNKLILKLLMHEKKNGKFIDFIQILTEITAGPGNEKVYHSRWFVFQSEIFKDKSKPRKTKTSENSITENYVSIKIILLHSFILK